MKKLIPVLVRALRGALVLVSAELVIASFFGRKELVGAWELGQAFAFILPFGWLVTLPAALAGAALLEGIRSSERRPWRLLVAATSGLFAALVAYGVTTGRHFESIPIRASFCALFALFAFAIAFTLSRPLARLVRERPRTIALFALSLALALEVANLLVLPRLYPAFHTALLVLTMALAPAIALAWPSTQRRPEARPIQKNLASWRLGGSFLLLLAVTAAAPFFAKKLALQDNLRLVYLDRAPLLRQGLELAAWMAPPPPLDPDFALHDQPVASSRALDWRGRDIVLITVDALRADHVGAYGHSRPTTPRLDALASEGALFERAYAPTPNTSYSITSLMTGKHMRPLALQGLGESSDTFAKLLQGYGYRTAAFYPPAIYFTDGEKLASFRDNGLDFEYRKIEFADAPKRLEQVEAYLNRRKPERRLFLWIHLFEPHEPYIAHPEHPFGARDIDRYDSEIAAADRGIGKIVDAVHARRPEAIVIVTADHGEEFGDHGGRFHGATVYEEQVRVPLIVFAKGSVLPKRIAIPVQTIDILPTVLSALDIPRPARIRGRDLGKLLRDGEDDALGDGLALAESEEQSLLAEGSFRLVCQRKVGACALYDLESDPAQQRDVSLAHVERFEAMKQRLRKLAASHGQFERTGLRGEGKLLPEALRRGLSGDADAAVEIAALLDDAEVVYRRKAAEVLFKLKRKEAASQLRLALARDEDDEVRRWSALALTRIGEGAPRTIELLEDADPKWARLAALALCDSGDARGGEILTSWWEKEPPSEYALARDIVWALGKAKEKRAIPSLLRSLDDIRLRTHIARTLGDIGDGSARKALADTLAEERYEHARRALAEALIRLGAKQELAPRLVRFLGTPDPLPQGLGLALRAGILDQVGGPRERALAELHKKGGALELTLPEGGNGTGFRILVRHRSLDDDPATLRLVLPGSPAFSLKLPPSREVVETHEDLPSFTAPKPRSPLRLVAHPSPNALIEALAIVPLADEIPPPPPEPWEGESGEDEDEPD